MNEAREQEEADVFDPVRCNVAFGSAHDGMQLNAKVTAVHSMSKHISDTHPSLFDSRTEALTRALWGDFAFSAKDKRVVRLRRGGADSKAKPMFVQFILEAVWKVRRAARTVCAARGGGDVAGVLGQICKARGLGHLVPARALEQSDPKQALRAVLRAWLPLSEAVLGMAVAQLPSPAASAPYRLPRLLGHPPGCPGPALLQSLPPSVSEVLLSGEAAAARSGAEPDAPLLVFVSKMVSVPRSSLP
ncbi:hypothetical protein QJQ45_023207, partial [Haematococcus lacustris]